MSRFPAVFQESNLKRNFFSVARANVVGLIIPVAALPLLSRLYSPADFSLLAVFSAVVAVLLSFATWRMEWTLPNAKSMPLAANVLAVGFIILLTSFLVFLFVVLVGLRHVNDLRILEQLGWWVWLMPLAVFGGGLRQLLEGWYVRNGDLRLIGSAAILQTTSNVTLSVGGGFAGLGAVGLLVSVLGSTWISLLPLGLNSINSLHRNLLRISKRTLKRAAKAYLPSATWSTAVSVVNASSFNVPVLLLAFFFTPQQVGCYALVHRMVAAPMGAISAALGQSFWARAAALAREREYDALHTAYLHMTYWLGAASTLVIAVCFAAPLFLGPLLGGGQWNEASYIMFAMTPLFVGGLVFSPTNHLVVLHRQPLQLLADCARLILVLLGVSVAVFFDSSFVITVLFLSVGSFCGHALLFLIHLLCHENIRRS